MHYRRQLALEEAKAWAEAHKEQGIRSADGRRIPAEIQGVQIKGAAKLSTADGRIENLPWGFAKSSKEVTVKVDKKTGRRVYAKMHRDTVKTGPSDGTEAIRYQSHQGPTVEQIARETQVYAYAGRNSALREISQGGGLKPTTAVLGEKVKPEHRLSTPASRQTRVVRLSALDRVSVDPETGRTKATSHGEILVDRSRLQRIAAQELEEILLLHLTEKETRALKQRAEGEAVTDRHTLNRAQRKAQAALAGA